MQTKSRKISRWNNWGIAGVSASMLAPLSAWTPQAQAATQTRTSVGLSRQAKTEIGVAMIAVAMTDNNDRRSRRNRSNWRTATRGRHRTSNRVCSAAAIAPCIARGATETEIRIADTVA